MRESNFSLREAGPVEALPPMRLGPVLFADHDDLATRLGITLTTAEQARADALLTIASGLVQAETRQDVEQVVDDVLSRPGTHDYQVRLPQRPVVSVSSVVLDGTMLTLDTDYVVIADRLIRVVSTATQAGFVINTQEGWGDPTQTLVVTYTHGFDPIPDVIKAVCLEAVVRVWVNPGAVIRETMGPESTQYVPTTHATGGGGSPVGLLLQPNEKQIVRYVLSQAAGVSTLR